jgi:hypothetical protein
MFETMPNLRDSNVLPGGGFTWGSEMNTYNYSIMPIGARRDCLMKKNADE